MSQEDVAKYQAETDALKQMFFGRTDITFHEPWMRNHDGQFRFDNDLVRQREFDAALDSLLEATPFVAFGVGVRKAAVAPYFQAAGLDPYLPTDAYALAIILLLERFVDYLGTNPEARVGRVTLESQGQKENAFHQLEYARVLLDGSQWISGSTFQSWLEPGLRFVVKHGSDPTELADMLVRDIFEWIRSDCAVQPRRWGLFSKRFYRRGDCSMGKFGLKVFPDSDLRQAIDDHREACMATEAVAIN